MDVLIESLVVPTHTEAVIEVLAYLLLLLYLTARLQRKFNNRERRK